MSSDIERNSPKNEISNRHFGASFATAGLAIKSRMVVSPYRFPFGCMYLTCNSENSNKSLHSRSVSAQSRKRMPNLNDFSLFVTNRISLRADVPPENAFATFE